MNNQKSTKLKILVIGANGGIGAQSVRLALAQNHQVTAVMRSPEKLAIRHERLTVVKGDVLNASSMINSFEGQDIIISAIGSNSTKETTLYSKGVENVLTCMSQTGVTRCLFISASGLEVNPSFNFFLRFLTKYVLQKILKEMFADLKRMEIVIKRSDLNWTIIRPPQLTNASTTGKYRYSINRYLDQGKKISRGDVSHFILSHLDDTAIYKSTIEVAY